MNKTLEDEKAALNLDVDENGVVHNWMKEQHAEDEDGIQSNHYTDSQKIAWYALFSETATCIPGEDSTSYAFNTLFHKLRSTVLHITLPEIEIKKEFRDTTRIAWPHNVVHNVVMDGTFCVDNVPGPRLDRAWLDIDSQWLRKNRNITSAYAGNLNFLESWQHTMLPAYTLGSIQPFFYSRGSVMSFPLFLCSGKSVIQKYTFKREITSLLRIQIRKNDKWLDVEPKKRVKVISRRLINVPKSIEQPKLTAYYSMLSNEEVERVRGCSTSHTFYVEDILSIDSPSETKYGETALINIVSRNPCRAIFWMAENITSSKKNNYSNYTTNSEDLHDGWDPIHSTKLLNGTTARFSMTGQVSSVEIPLVHHQLRVPKEVGYHCNVFCHDPTSVDREVGILMPTSAAAIFRALLEPNIPKNVGDSFNKDETFKLLLRLQIIRKITIETTPVFKFTCF